MLVLMLQHVSSRVSGFPVAWPCLWAKLQNLSFSKVSKQVVTWFCLASVALPDILMCLETYRQSFCAANAVFVLRFPKSWLHFSWQTHRFGDLHHNFAWQAQHFRRVVLRALHSTLHTPHTTFYTPHFALHTLHFTLHTPHFTLYTPPSTLYTPHFTLHTLHSTLRTPHFTLQTPDSTVHTLHSRLYTLHSTLPTSHSRLQPLTVHTLHSTLYTLHSALHTLHSTFHTPHFTIYTLHFTLYIPHSTLYSPHFTLYTPHSTHSTLYTLCGTLRTPHFTLHTLHSTPFRTPQSSGTVTGEKCTRLFKQLVAQKCFYVTAFEFVGCILFFPLGGARSQGFPAALPSGQEPSTRSGEWAA